MKRASAALASTPVSSTTAMMATLLGAVVSDGLDDGQVVSGVGGQYNFVAQAFALQGARSILTVESTRQAGAGVASNIRWNYGHATIPRHLRDVIITEYGVADLRGKSDADVIATMLAVTDSRFQDELMRQAREAGKLSAELPDPGGAARQYASAHRRRAAAWRARPTCCQCSLQRHVDEGLWLHLLDVGAGGESLFAAGDQNASDFIVGLEVIDGGRNLAKHAERKRVEHFRTVQRDDADRPFALDNDVFERRHDPPRSLISRAMCPLPGWASSGGWKHCGPDAGRSVRNALWKHLTP